MEEKATLIANENKDEHESKEGFIIKEEKQCNKPTKSIQVFRNE